MTSPARVARVAAGIAVRDVARRTGLSQECIRLAERPGGRVGYMTAMLLARIYGCDALDFIRRQEMERPATVPSVTGRGETTNDNCTTTVRGRA